MTRSFCLVTKTYAGDAEAFGELCKSIDLHMPDLVHYVLVDRSDLAMFAGYASERRKIVDCSKLLPQFHEFNVLGKRLWWRLPNRIVRGWVYQQVVKIKFVSTLEYDAAVIIDSDAIFVRPIRPEQVFEGDAVRLYRSEGTGSGEEHSRWHDVAMRSYDLTAVGYTGYDYISTAVVWSPAVVRAMIEKQESVSRRKWYDVLVANFRFSEYIQYGVFCDRVEGPHQQMVSATQGELSHCSWHYDVRTPEGIAVFVDSIEKHHCAILLQSNLKMEDAERRRIFDAIELVLAREA